MLLGALLLGAPAAAQQAVPLDSAVREPVRAATSADSAPRDSIKAAYATSERPRAAELRHQEFQWSREQIFIAGAHNLAELLVDVPGVGLQRSSYLMSPIVTSYFGEAGRTRVFLDGLEIDPLDARTGGQLDLANIPLYGLESVSLERLAGELRVHLRSWRVDRTTPTTRVDVGTGSEAYSMYRAYYGKRMQNGAGLQLAGQQFTTVNSITRGDGESLSMLARLGWASGDWSVDAFGLSVGRSRQATRRYVRTSPVDRAMARFTGSERLGYLRLGYRNPDSSGLWLQALAGTQLYLEDDSLASGGSTPDADTLRSGLQYVLTGGVTRGALRLSGSGRYRLRGGRGVIAPSLRASWMGTRASLAGSVEMEGPDSTLRSDVSGALQLASWLHVAAAASQYSNNLADRRVMRGEIGLTWAGRWISAGAIQRSASPTFGMLVFDPDYVNVTTPASQGLFASVGGPIWGPFSLNWQGIDWGDEQFYRPKMESRSVLRAASSFRQWIPRNTFRLDASLVHEYRSDLLAPGGIAGIQKAKGNSAISLLVDIRLGSAHIFFHNRNLTGEVYETVPGYLMPRLVQQYGVRWDFWN